MVLNLETVNALNDTHSKEEVLNRIFLWWFPSLRNLWELVFGTLNNLIAYYHILVWLMPHHLQCIFLIVNSTYCSILNF